MSGMEEEKKKRKLLEDYSFEVKKSPERENIDVEICDCEQCVKEAKQDNQEEKYFAKVVTEEQKWTDEDVRVLLELWRTKEILYNTKHPLYYNKDERCRVIDEMRAELNVRGLMFTTKQVNDKVTNLRTYYGGQKRLEASKKSDGELYVSKWKFYSDMSFLCDSIVHRSTQDHLILPTDSDDLSSHCRHAVSKYQKSSKRLKRKSQSDDFHTGVTNIQSPLSSVSEHTSGKSQDELFGELITKMISDLPECHEKAILKIELQHKIVTAQYKISSQHKS